MCYVGYGERGTPTFDKLHVDNDRFLCRRKDISG